MDPCMAYTSVELSCAHAVRCSSARLGDHRTSRASLTIMHIVSSRIRRPYPIASMKPILLSTAAAVSMTIWWRSPRPARNSLKHILIRHFNEIYAFLKIFLGADSVPRRPVRYHARGGDIPRCKLMAAVLVARSSKGMSLIWCSFEVNEAK